MDNHRRDARRRVMSADYADEQTAKNAHVRQQPAVPVPQRSASLQSSGSSRHNGRLNAPKGADPVDDRDASFSSDTTSFAAMTPLVRKEDQRVRAEVERVLKLRPQVVASLKSEKSHGRLSDVTAESQSASSSASGGLPPIRSSMGHERRRVVTMPSRVAHPFESVDFSPSVKSVPPHPVPTSANDGATLDWSRDDFEDDKRGKRWSLSRRILRDKSPPHRRTLVERQESIYSDKLARIRGKVSPVTLRKADITRFQLKRRYDALQQALQSKDACLNIVDVARWFSQQPEEIKPMFDEMEPRPWLRHYDGSDDKSFQRLPWHLSALVVEEYLQVKNKQDAMTTIPEHTSPSDATSGLGFSPILSAKTSKVLSYATSLRSLENRRRLSDDHISFEPQTHSRRGSLEKEPHRSLEASVRNWRNSMQGVREGMSPTSSPQGSIHTNILSGLGKSRNVVGSPASFGTSSPVQGKRIRWGYERSEDGSSSAADSLSEDPRSFDERSGSPSKRRLRRSLLASPNASKGDLTQDGRAVERPLVEKIEPIPTITTPRPDQGFRFPAKSPTPASLFLGVAQAMARPKTHQSLQIPSHTVRDIMSTARPIAPSDSADAEEVRRKKEAQQKARRQEYGRKRETLDALRAQNARIKSQLQSTSRIVRQFDDLQTLLADTFHVAHEGLPQAVFEAFAHDPAGVTSHTYKLTGWKAVEEIHDRVVRQNETLRLFIDNLPSSLPIVPLTCFSICDERMQVLSFMLDELVRRFEEVAVRVPEVESMGERVKELRGTVKAAFDYTERHTSANYPELVRLDGLLDIFDSNKHQLWKLAERTLSLLLSFVAPFMKTFGRPIWDDVHDFLVIPWYRNEFSGEDQWYPVKFPRRSFLHWIFLFCMAFSAPLGLLSTLQVVTALLTEVRLDDIPYLAPRIFIWTLFSMLMLIFLITILILSATVLGEVVMFFWWLAWFCRLVE